jgi:phosphohistidine phosphatase
MKTLLLLRHAKSSWKDSEIDDHERPLNKRGKKDAPRMGRLLKEENLLPDLILSSSAKRCRKTADEIIQHSGFRGETRLTIRLYEADAAAIRECLSQTEDTFQRVLVIGHNPGLEEFLESLVKVDTPLSTAALARVDLAIDSWRDLAATPEAHLIGTWQPRSLEE